MNRPRESVLSLFDPLANSAPSTPPRSEVSSPTLGSDKENAAPAEVGHSPVTLTKFFSRTYTRYKALPPKLPKGGLIDFGDVTITDEVDLDDMGDDSDEDAENKGDVTFVLPHRSIAIGSPQRRPLADIALEDGDATPIATKNPLVDLLQPDAAVFTLARPTAAPASSPLAAVINSINGTTSPSPPPISPPPQIAVIPAEPSSPSPSRPTLRTRPTDGLLSTSTSSLDPRRTSVDLQNSFSMHFPDASFDLINDKISFLGNDSFPEIDLEAEEAEMMVLASKLELKAGLRARRRAEESDRGNMASSESEGETDIDEVLADRLRDVHLGGDSESEDERPKEQFSTPILHRPPGSSSVLTPKAPAPVRQFVRPRSGISPPLVSHTAPVRSEQHVVPSFPTNPPPLPPRAAPISRLRIVKKNIVSGNRDRAESESAQSTASLRPMPTCSTIPPAMAVADPTAHAPAPRQTRPRVPVVGVQRPPAGAAVPARVKVPPSATAATMRGTRSTASVSMGRAAASRLASAGIFAPPTSATTGKDVNATTTASARLSRLQRAASTSGLTGKSVSAPVPVPGTAKTGGLRPPSRIGSMVPRPAGSRLPVSASTGTVRGVRGEYSSQFGLRKV